MALSGSHQPSLTSQRLSAPPPPPPPPVSLIQELQALVQKLTDEDVTTLKKLVVELDAKELKAAGRYIAAEKKGRCSKKELELEKKLRWNLLTRPRRFETISKEAKDIVDIELGDAVKPQCYEEITRLLKIEKHPIYAKALGEWSRKESLFTSRVERKKTKVADLKNEIYQLIGFFSVFQGVLLTAVSQSNLLHCNNWWSPIVLSVVASFVTVFGVVQKLYQIASFQKNIHSEEQSLKEVAARLNTLRNKGVDKFEFAQFEYRVDKEQSKFRFRIYFWLVIGSLIVFTAGFPFSHWRILCYPGPNPWAVFIIEVHHRQFYLEWLAMVKVTVRNTTNINVKIQEGNAGVFTTRATLRPQGKFTLDLDPHATYREYVLVRLPDNTPLEPMFSSDDVVEVQEIIIQEQEGDPKYCWDKVLRGQRNDAGRSQVTLNQPNNGSADPVDNPPASRAGWLSRFRDALK